MQNDDQPRKVAPWQERETRARYEKVEYQSEQSVRQNFVPYSTTHT